MLTPGGRLSTLEGCCILHNIPYNVGVSQSTEVRLQCWCSLHCSM